MVLESAPLHLTSAADNNNSITPRNAGSAAAASTAHSIRGSSLPGDTAGADAAAGQRQGSIGHRRQPAPGDGQLRDSVARHGIASRGSSLKRLLAGDRHGVASRGSAWLSHGRGPGPGDRPPARSAAAARARRRARRRRRFSTVGTGGGFFTNSDTWRHWVGEAGRAGDIEGGAGRRPGRQRP